MCKLRPEASIWRQFIRNGILAGEMAVSGAIWVTDGKKSFFFFIFQVNSHWDTYISVAILILDSQKTASTI